jgi:hypothetical protein
MQGASRGPQTAPGAKTPASLHRLNVKYGSLVNIYERAKNWFHDAPVIRSDSSEASNVCRSACILLVTCIMYMLYTLNAAVFPFHMQAACTLKILTLMRSYGARIANPSRSSSEPA